MNTKNSVNISVIVIKIKRYFDLRYSLTVRLCKFYSLLISKIPEYLVRIRETVLIPPSRNDGLSHPEKYMKKATVRFLSVIGITLVMLFEAGCAYRPDLHQGNFTEQKDVDKLRVGMTQEQVKFVLGTPMLLDPLDDSRWYYINFVREGWNAPEYRTLIVIFDEDRVVREISGDFQKPQKFYTPLTQY